MTYRPITDVWFLARCKYRGGVKRYGGYLGGFPERARALLGVHLDDPVLHVCGGLARLYPYKGGFGPNDRTLDLDPEVDPDFRTDAMGELPAGFRAMLADPPYSEEDAAKYATGAVSYPSPHRLAAHMVNAVPIGCRVGIIHYAIPRCPPGARFVACIGVVCGFGNRGRFFTVFERPATPHKEATP